MRWGWRRLLILPLLASVHACDCGSCALGNLSNCGDFATPCGFGGQCVSEAGACAGDLRLDPTMSCDDAGGFCCVAPPPACAALGGVCREGPSVAAVCASGGIDGECGDGGVCCVPSPGDDGAADAADEGIDSATEDADAAPDAAAIGSCNGSPCESGCACEPLPLDAGGGRCRCAVADASAGEGDADAGDAGPGEASSPDAETSDGAAPEADAIPPAESDADADTGGCGVILCAAGCTCVSVTSSACVCP